VNKRYLRFLLICKLEAGCCRYTLTLLNLIVQAYQTHLTHPIFPAVVLCLEIVLVAVRCVKVPRVEHVVPVEYRDVGMRCLHRFVDLSSARGTLGQCSAHELDVR
jgi:hypothetical protein